VAALGGPARPRLIAFRTVASIVPIEGWLVDFLFRGHMLAANALQRDIARRFGRPSAAAIAEARRHPFDFTTGAAVPV
jgi:hypothetical protein